MTKKPCVLTLALLLVCPVAELRAQGAAKFSELAPGTLLFPTDAGNVVAVGTPAGAFVVGPVSSASTGAIQAVLTQRTPSPIRYVIANPNDRTADEGDGGWGRLGAFVAAQEKAWGRMWDSSRYAARGAQRPRAAFSEVLKFNFGGQEIHAIHQPAGHSNADVLVHFEDLGIVYLGESLPGDGYPMIDSARGGTLDGVIETLAPWVNPGKTRYVPAHGAAVTNAEVRAFRDMLISVRDSVRALRTRGWTLDQVIAAQPTRPFDARFGAGRVTPVAFVRSAYRAPPKP